MRYRAIAIVLSSVFLVNYTSNADSSIQNESSTVTTNKKSTAKRSKKTVKKQVSNQNKDFLDNNQIDIVFNDNLNKLPYYFKQYDPTIKVLSPLGLKKDYDINIDIQNADLSTIQDVVSNKTGGKAQLVFDSNNNSLRIVYDNKVTVARNTIQQSEIWQAGGTPKPVLGSDGLVMLPYGQYEPKVTCQTQMLCDIQLQAGEIINNILLGDTANWTDSGPDGQQSTSVPIAYSGPDSNRIPHVVLTPRSSGLSTILMITTTKRTYYLKLYSSNSSNVSRIGFYYPGQVMQTIAESKQAQQFKDNQSIGTNIDPKNLYFKYTVDGDKHAPFYPSQVFDDGVRVYIQLSQEQNLGELPVLYVIGPDGVSRDIVNYTYKEPFFIVQQRFNQAILTRGQDENEVTVTISREGKDPGFFARIFGSK
jgi:type IV secretion system protein VirB9